MDKSINSLIQEFDQRKANIAVVKGIRMKSHLAPLNEAYERLGESIALAARIRGYLLPDLGRIETVLEPKDYGMSLCAATKARLEKDENASSILHITSAYRAMLESVRKDNERLIATIQKCLKKRSFALAKKLMRKIVR